MFFNQKMQPVMIHKTAFFCTLFNCPCQCLQQLCHLRIRQDLHQKLRINTGRLTGLLSCDLSGCLFLIEDVLKDLSVVFTVFIQNMRVLIRDHLGLGMTGITLYGFYITAIQFQLIGDAGMTQAVENDLWQIMLLDQLIKQYTDP